MKVKCLHDVPDYFPGGSEVVSYFKNTIKLPEELRRLNFVSVSKIYTVYAVLTRANYTFYYVRNERNDHFVTAPSLCFEILDDRMSSLWRFKHYQVKNEQGPRAFKYLMAIKEWVNEPDFHFKLFDEQDREMKIMAEAADFMDREFEN